MEACNEGDVNTVRRLLFEGHNANETTEDGESLLSLACSAGYYELAEVIMPMPQQQYTMLSYDKPFIYGCMCKSHQVIIGLMQYMRIIMQQSSNCRKSNFASLALNLSQ